MDQKTFTGADLSPNPADSVDSRPASLAVNRNVPPPVAAPVENPYAQFTLPEAPAPAAMASVEPPLSLADRATDLARGVVGGARDAVQGVTDTALSGMEVISGAVNKVVGGDQPATDATYKAIRTKMSFSEAEKNTTVLGSITREVMKWTVGMRAVGLVGKGLGLAPTTIAGKTAVAAGEGAASGYAFSDPHAANLGNLLDSVPALHGPVTEFLAQNPNSSDSVNKLRGALENTVVMGLVEPLVLSFKAYRASQGALAAGKTTEAKAIVEAAGPKIDTAMSKAMTSEVDLAAKSGQVIDPLEAQVAKDRLGFGPTAETPTVASQRVLTLSASDQETLTAGLKLHGVEAGLKLDMKLSEGAINYKNIQTPQDGINILSDLVSVVRDKLPNIAGTSMKLEHVKDLATWASRDATSLFSELAESAAQVAGHANPMKQMEAQVIGGKILVKTFVDQMVTEAARLGSGLQQDRTGMAKLADLLTTTLDNVAGLRTAAARTTAAGAVKVDSGISAQSFSELLKSTSGGDAAIDALAERIRMADSIEGVVKAAKVITPTVSEKFMAVYNHLWINGVLGGLKTTFTNVSTTLGNTLLMPAYRYMGGVVTRNPEQRDQAVLQWQFMKENLGASISMARRSWRTGNSILLPNSNPVGATSFEPGKLAEYLSPGIEDGPLKTLINGTSSFFGWAGRFLTSQDEAFKQITYRSHLMASEYVNGMKQGLEGDALKNFVKSKLEASMNEAGAAIHQAGAGALAARAATFTQKLGMDGQDKWMSNHRTFGEIASSAATGSQILKGFVLPFVNVPTNLFRQGIEMTPIAGFAYKHVVNDFRGLNGAEAQTTAIGKMAFGSMLWASAGMLAAEDRITGAGPKDPDLRRAWLADHLPYSIHVGTNADGTKNWVSYQRLQPFALPFGIIADMAQAHAHLGEGVMDSYAAQAVAALVKNLGSQTYLRGLTEALDVVSDPSENAGKWLKSRASSLVPSVAQTLMVDDELKSVRGVTDAFLAKIPGLSSSVEARRDNFGDKVMPPMGWPWTGINPFTFFTATADPVRKELSDLAATDAQAKFPLPAPKTGPLDLRDFKDPTTRQSAYDRLMEIHQTLQIEGQTLHGSIQNTINSSEYATARAKLGQGDAVYRRSLAVDMIEQKFQLYERVARLQLERERPDIGAAQRAFKLGEKTSRVQGSNTAPDLQQLKDIAEGKGGGVQ